jgi:peptidoglycan hydrolase-like protein with peptidoglycan-binding domain
MRISFLSLVAALFILSYAPGALAESVMTQNLSLGSRGAQVLALQQALNGDPDTRIASSGPGSPGYETDYFGSLTKAAVMRFQEKYASEILAPAGLSRGNGYVGFYTRTKLNALSTSNAPNEISEVTPPTTTSPPPASAASLPASSAPTPAQQNPNLENLDTFLSFVDSEATKKGLSATHIAAIKDQFIKTAATTTDLRAAFSKMAIRTPNQAVEDDSVVGRALAMIERAIEKVFMPERALAGAGVPFGGALLYASPCFCSGTWIIGIQPLPPTYATLLTYMPGSQANLSYNIPVTSELLGFYAPGAGVCLVPGTPCFYVPNGGLITPMVGSSPI